MTVIFEVLVVILLVSLVLVPLLLTFLLSIGMLFIKTIVGLIEYLSDPEEDDFELL